MLEEARLHGPVRDISPCKDCTEKFTACHDRCPKDERGEIGYLAWKANKDKVNKERKEYMKDRRFRWQRTNF